MEEEIQELKRRISELHSKNAALRIENEGLRRQVADYLKEGRLPEPLPEEE